MAVSSILIWRLEEPKHTSNVNADFDRGGNEICADSTAGKARDGEGEPEMERSDACCVALRETTYDLKLD